MIVLYFIMSPFVEKSMGRKNFPTSRYRTVHVHVGDSVLKFRKQESHYWKQLKTDFLFDQSVAKIKSRFY